MPLPRAFFTTLQRTQIKLIVTPNTKKTNTVLTVRHDQTLVVKIDGIIGQQCKLAEPLRTVKKVEISLTTELDTKSMSEANKVLYFGSWGENEYFNRFPDHILDITVKKISKKFNLGKTNKKIIKFFN
jgi:hypothetical protein